MLEQFAERDIEVDAIVHCTGSGSTMAGLVAGLHALDSDIKVIGIDDTGDARASTRLVTRLANETLDLLGIDVPLPESKIQILADFAADGYGIPDGQTIAAIRLAAETEALLTDPVYEGKSMAGLIELVRSRRLPADSRVVYLHMGGTPAIHGYTPELWPSSDTGRWEAT